MLMCGLPYNTVVSGVVYSCSCPLSVMLLEYIWPTEARGFDDLP